jgi:hypothetical protein
MTSTGQVTLAIRSADGKRSGLLKNGWVVAVQGRLVLIG